MAKKLVVGEKCRVGRKCCFFVNMKLAATLERKLRWVLSKAPLFRTLLRRKVRWAGERKKSSFI